MKKALIFLLTVMLLSSILPVAWAEDPLIRLFGEGEAVPKRMSSRCLRH